MSGIDREGYPASTAYWAEAEEPLLHLATSDVLVIMDGPIYFKPAAKRRKTERSTINDDFRCYQVMASTPASDSDPKEITLTTSLCDSLEKLFEAHPHGIISLKDILKRTNHDGSNHLANLWKMHHHNGCIALARLARPEEGDQSSRAREKGQASLTLRFSLNTADLTREQIKLLAANLPNAFKEVGVPLLTMDWIEMEAGKRNRVTLFEAARVVVVLQRFLRKVDAKKRLHGADIDWLNSRARYDFVLERMMERDILTL